jgi:integrase
MNSEEAKRRTGRKRGNGEGSIRQRTQDGLWEARITLPNGVRKSFYGRTRAEVVKKLTAAKRTLDQGLPITTGRNTVGDFLKRWLEEVARPSVRPSTYVGYRNAVINHLIPALGKLPLEKLTPQEVQRLLNDRAQIGLSPRTVQLIRAVLRRALGQAVKWRLLAYNAAQLVDPPRQRRYVARVWTPEETRRFLEAVQGDRFEALYTTAIYLGLRQGEILALRWTDIDFERRILRVSGTMPTVGPREVSEPKTERSRRVLPLPEPVANALHQHRVRQLEERLRAGEGWQERGLVFTNVFGGPVDRKGLHYRFKQAIARAGLPDIRFHDLRHGCATFLLAQGVPARAVMELLGHSSIKTTMDVYAHVLPPLLDDAATKLTGLLARGNG